MKVWQCDDSRPAPGLVPAEVETPQPQRGEVLIRVHAVGVTDTELLWQPTTHTKSGENRHHAIPGHEFSGAIAAVGVGADGIVGQEVFGMNDWYAQGATAEFCCASGTGTPWFSVENHAVPGAAARAAALPQRRGREHPERFHHCQSRGSRADGDRQRRAYRIDGRRASGDHLGEPGGGHSGQVSRNRRSSITGATRVSFGANAGTNIQINSDSTLNVTSPSSATGGTVDVRVTSALGIVSQTTAADQFTYIKPP
jgi:hypothetical protein